MAILGIHLGEAVQSKRKASLVMWVVPVIAVAGCGGDAGEKGTSTTGGGTVTAPWEAYCTATFTEDYQVVDEWGDALFAARADDSYLVARFGDPATLYYLTASGPYDFPVSAIAGTQDLPFVSNCNPSSTIEYYGAFTDTAVFADEELTTKLCDIPAGTALPREPTNAGYAGVDFNLSGPSTYEIILNAFSAQCGGAESGFVSVPETTVFGVTTWLVPIQTLVGPQ